MDVVSLPVVSNSCLPITDGVEYRYVAGYVDYAVGNDGSVWSKKSKYPSHRMWHKLAGSNDRYKTVRLYKSGAANVYVLIHKLIAFAFIGPRPIGFTINHVDGVKTNNAASNLEYVTQQDNIRHAWRCGLAVARPGEKHSAAKLSDAQVHEIMRLLAVGKSQQQIATQFGVSRPLISLYKNGKLRTNITVMTTKIQTEGIQNVKTP